MNKNNQILTSIHDNLIEKIKEPGLIKIIYEYQDEISCKKCKKTKYLKQCSICKKHFCYIHLTYFTKTRPFNLKYHYCISSIIQHKLS